VFSLFDIFKIILGIEKVQKTFLRIKLNYNRLIEITILQHIFYVLVSISKQ